LPRIAHQVNMRRKILFLLFIGSSLSAFFFIDASQWWLLGCCVLGFLFMVEAFYSLCDKLRAQTRALADERSEHEAILEFLGEGVTVVDAKMRVLYVNFVAAKMLAISQRTALGKEFPKAEGLARAELIEKCRFLLATCQEKLNVVTDSIAVEEGR